MEGRSLRDWPEAEHLEELGLQTNKRIGVME
jgi:hypothetical protein